jgi:hypothetical protein
MARPSSDPKPKQVKLRDEFIVPAGFDIEGKLEFKPPEDPDAKRHRLRKEVWSFWVKEALTYIVALIILLMTAVYCFWVLLKPGTTLEERKWVMSVVTSLIVGIVGYVFGKSTK